LLHKRKSELDFYEKNLELLMPENVLRRGYTITYLNGKIKNTKEGLSEGNVIETKFIDGIISSKVIEDKDEPHPLFPPLPGERGKGF
jgi:exodeoxyribonuclease VII large subunit